MNSGRAYIKKKRLRTKNKEMKIMKLGFTKLENLETQTGGKTQSWISGGMVS